MKSYDYTPNNFISNDYASQSDYISLKAQELEALLEKTQRAKQAAGLLTVWQKLWKIFAATFIQTSEPKIHQRTDRFGNVYFHVYDPQTGRSSVFGTESEVRAWLDRRYYEA